METLGFIGCQFAVYMTQTCFLLSLKHSLGFNLYFQAQSYRDNSDSLSVVAPEIEDTQKIRVIMGSRDR